MNESNSYHDVGEAMMSLQHPTFLVGDHTSIRRYGLGIAKPFPISIGPNLRSGYLIRGDTIEQLAERAGINPRTLAETVRSLNAAAREGREPICCRGANVYNRYQGDSGHEPNACLAPLDVAPFYAVRIYPGDLNTIAGLRTDAHARVLDRVGTPIRGLYAAGTDMVSIFGGCYPGPGINLGSALTFGYIAALELTAAAWDLDRQRDGSDSNVIEQE